MMNVACAIISTTELHLLFLSLSPPPPATLMRLAVETQVSIRPFTHKEYERFLVAAYPYYASALSVMVGFLLFCGAFLFSGDAPASKSVAGK